MSLSFFVLVNNQDKPCQSVFFFTFRTKEAEWSPVRVNGAYGFGRSLGLVAAGGYNVDGSYEHFKSVVATKDGKTITNLEDMPLALAVSRTNMGMKVAVSEFVVNF